MTSASRWLIPRSEKQIFVEELNLLLSSGMSISMVLDAIHATVRSSTLKNIIKEMNVSIESGMPLWKALSETGIFPIQTIALLRVGEQTGRLTENLAVISREQQKEREFQSKVKSALLYPVFVLTLAGVVGIGISWFILPKLATVFVQLRIPLPFITRLLIGLGLFFQAHGVVTLLLVFVIAISVIYFLFFFRKTVFLGQAFLLSLPGIGRLLREVELSRFGYLFGTLLSAGIPIVDAIDALAEATSLKRYRRLYEYLRDRIEEGETFQRAFAHYKGAKHLIPISIQQMVVTAEASGKLPETLQNIGGIYDSKVQTTTKDLAVVLEPILLVIVWLGVLGVALAVILPIYQLTGNLNQ